MAILTTVKRRVLVNPGRARRKLSPLQKMYFGSKRQRAAIMRNKGRRYGSIRKAKKALKKEYRGSSLSPILTRRGEMRPLRKFRSNAGKGSFRKSLKAWKTQRRSEGYGGYVLKAGRAAGKRAIRARKKNISNIVTVYPNPGGKKRKRIKYGSLIRKWAEGSKKKNMARHYRRRRNRGRNRGYAMNRRRRNRRRNAGTAYGRSWSHYKGKAPRRRKNRSYRRNPHVIVRYRNRKANRHYARRRRNPGFGLGLNGTASKVLGVLGGIAVTKLVMGLIPTTLSSGVLGYITGAVVAVAQGKLIGKVSKNSGLGDNFMVGGIAYVAAKILNDFFPTIGAYTGVSGMGLLGGTTFYVPNVNVPGTMGTMMVPGGVQAAIAAAAQPATPSTGVGKLRRTGRLM